MDITTPKVDLPDIVYATKYFRNKKGMTQGDIFRATGLERSFLSRLESGAVQSPRFKTIALLAFAFGVSVTEFIKVAEGGEKKYGPLPKE